MITRWIKLYILSFSLLTSSISIAQVNSENREIEYSIAKEYFDSRDYRKALPLFLELDSIMPNTPRYMYPISICYMNISSDNNKALSYINKCLEQPDMYPPTLFYYAGRCYHLSHKMEDAIKFYQQYETTLKKGSKKQQKKDAGTIKEVERLIEMCKNGKTLMLRPIEIEVVNLGAPVNTIYPEYGAVINATEDEIIFTSSRPNTTGGGIDYYDGGYYEDIYVSYKTEKGWSAPENMGTHINTSGHDASISLTPDGQQLIIYRYGKHTNIIQSSGNLYISRQEGKEWTPAEMLPQHINSKGWEPSACISEDGRVMYFASNMKGGYGGTDIYMVRKLPNGNWALPMNMGPNINTSFNEDSPYMHPDGKTFYFSSEGHNSMGGYDIFYSILNDSTKKWSASTNVGYPISTAHDDIHFSLSADGRRIYFSSVRPEGFGDKDIYFANVDKDAAHVLVLKGFVLDSLTLQPINATIKVINNRTQEIVGIYNSNASSGKYIMVLPEGRNYVIQVESDNYQLCSDILSTVELEEYTEMDKNIQLCPIMLNR